MVYLTANFETDIQIGQVGSGQTAAAEVIPHLPVKAFQALHQPGQMNKVHVARACCNLSR